MDCSPHLGLVRTNTAALLCLGSFLVCFFLCFCLFSDVTNVHCTACWDEHATFVGAEVQVTTCCETATKHVEGSKRGRCWTNDGEVIVYGCEVHSCSVVLGLHSCIVRLDRYVVTETAEHMTLLHTFMPTCSSDCY